MYEQDIMRAGFCLSEHTWLQFNCVISPQPIKILLFLVSCVTAEIRNIYSII